MSKERGGLARPVSRKGSRPRAGTRRLAKLGLKPDRWDLLIALAGNPNVGKTTVFNALTGLRQHTGNWPGKTVTRAEGVFVHRGLRVKVVDLPGSYSLKAASADEEVARDFVLSGLPDVVVAVVDAARLERNLSMVLQLLELTDRVVVCLNLVDEAGRHGIEVDAPSLERELGVPVVPAVARAGQGIDRLLDRATTLPKEAACERDLPRAEIPKLEAAVDALERTIQDSLPSGPDARRLARKLLLTDGHASGALEGTSTSDGPGVLGGAPFDSGDPGWKRVLAEAAKLRWELGPGFQDELAEATHREAARIARRAVKARKKRSGGFDRTLDRWLTRPITGFPVMLGILAVVFWLTIAGANAPSALLASLLIDTAHPALQSLASSAGAPWWLGGFLIDGVYLATAWVVSVMLPPMAIFFPLFTLLEDFGYLPRVAFNLDGLFRRAGAHGKQALTMSMGFGCNAAGVVAARVIDSPRERLIAIITNNFSLCNGRWPTQILIATIFIGALAPPRLAGAVSAAAVVSVALLGVALMFLTSWGLSRTVLRGEASTFSLELPPYRPPKILQTLYTSLIDRTLIILGRAVIFAVPAGAAIWLLSNVLIGDASLAERFIDALNPLGILVGLNGVILVAYVIAIPANEIVIPTILMLTVLTLGSPELGQGAGVMFEGDSPAEIAALLSAGGWTLLTGINLMLFSLLHNPCSTTIYTIYKETGSARWTAVASLLPLAMGFAACFLVAQLWRMAQG